MECPECNQGNLEYAGKEDVNGAGHTIYTSDNPQCNYKEKCI